MADIVPSHAQHHARRSAIAVAAALFAIAACKGDKTPLIDRINAYRAAPQECAGKPAQAVAPLAPWAALALVKIESAASSLEGELRRVDYPAARSQAIVIGGPRDAATAMAVLKERYCEELLSPRFSEIGIAREDRKWMIVLAQPLIPQDLGGWAYAGKQVLELVNRARAQPRACGHEKFAAAPALQWNAQLALAALAHSRDMAARNYFAHSARDGTKVDERATRAGYEWTRIGENVATGQGSAEQAVSSWLASPVHCANLMQPGFTQMGAAYVVNPASDTVIYWTQVFGAPR